MVNSTFAENHRGMWAAPEALPRTTGGCERLPKRYPECWMWGAKQYLSIILLITANYYFLLPTIPLSRVLIQYDGNNNTRRDKIDICNLPLLYTIAPKSTLQRSFNIDIYS